MTVVDPASRLDLEEQQQFLLDSLRDLEAERAAGDIDEADYRRLRDTYTTRAAAVLRALDGEHAPQAGGSDGSPGRAPQVRPAQVVARAAGGRRRTVAAVVLVGVCGALAGYAVAESSGERSLTAEATGSLPEASVDRVIRAQGLASQGKVLEAIKVYDSLLVDDPDNPVALAERGWLLSRVDPSLVEPALASIDRAIAADPAYPEARFFRGMILWRSKGDPAAAAAEFQKAIDAGPPAQLVTLLQQAREQALAAVSAAPPPAP